jgi:hypothetical protein
MSVVADFNSVLDAGSIPAISTTVKGANCPLLFSYGLPLGIVADF